MTRVGPEDWPLRRQQEKGSYRLAEGVMLGEGPVVADWTCTLYLSTDDTFPRNGQKYHHPLGTVLQLQWGRYAGNYSSAMPLH